MTPASETSTAVSSSSPPLSSEQVLASSAATTVAATAAAAAEERPNAAEEYEEGDDDFAEGDSDTESDPSSLTIQQLRANLGAPRNKKKRKRYPESGSETESDVPSSDEEFVLKTPLAHTFMKNELISEKEILRLRKERIERLLRIYRLQGLKLKNALKARYLEFHGIVQQRQILRHTRRELHPMP